MSQHKEGKKYPACKCMSCCTAEDDKNARERQERYEAHRAATDITRGEYEDLLARVEALEARNADA